MMASNGPQKSNGKADAVATLIIMTVVVTTVSFWLAGMPG
ncbi:methionine synthase [Congregibacter sp.]